MQMSRGYSFLCDFYKSIKSNWSKTKSDGIPKQSNHKFETLQQNKTSNFLLDSLNPNKHS